MNPICKLLIYSDVLMMSWIHGHVLQQISREIAMGNMVQYDNVLHQISREIAVTSCCPKNPKMRLSINEMGPSFKYTYIYPYIYIHNIRIIVYIDIRMYYEAGMYKALSAMLNLSCIPSVPE